jgi:hypothetical protein
MASEVLMTISRDEVERARLMSEFKYEIDTQSKIGYARKEGRAEGEAKSRQQILDLLAQGVSAEELRRRLTEA